jgi:hypothetical protein
MEEKHTEHHHEHSHEESEKLNPHEVNTLLAWKAPGRPYKKRSRSYFASLLLLTVLIEIILFLFSQYALMAVVVSLVFLAFALALTPPGDFQYRISTQGITVEDHFFLWTELYDFYFKKRGGIDVLHIRTYAMIPGELTLTLGSVTEAHVKHAMLPYLPYREYIKPTMMEKSADWLSKNFPLERE